MFARTWQYLAHAHQLEAPDSYLIAPVGDFAAVVLREPDGSLRAFGTRQPRSYELAEETLLAAAQERRELGMEELRLETWEQCYIFGTFDQQAVPLAESLGPLRDKASEVGLDYASLRHWQRITYEVEANWKIVVENSVECYHCNVAHPELVDLMDMEVFEQTVYGSGMVQEGPVQGDSRREEDASGYSYPSGGVQQGRYMFFWPTFYLLVYPGPGNVSTMRFYPRGPGRTIVVRDFYFSGEVSERRARRDRRVHRPHPAPGQRPVRLGPARDPQRRPRPRHAAAQQQRGRGGPEPRSTASCSSACHR